MTQAVRLLEPEKVTNLQMLNSQGGDQLKMVATGTVTQYSRQVGTVH